MSNLVIVAIPEEQDRVWKISSEQVPHLTLLFLGNEANADTQTVVEFVEHAVTQSEHGQFYLDVDRRGELGPDNADVLFFSKRSWNLKWITQFRNQLLQNPAIKTAYDSTQQYEEWQPHLTLGYPQTPAKSLGKDDYPIYSVCFDRIAVWDTDFAGPDFRLEWPDRELDGPLAVAYSDTQKAGIAIHTEGALEHFGIKGMKWGFRKPKDTTVTVNGKTKQVTAKKGAKLDKKWQKNIHSVHGAVDVHNAMAEHFNSRIGVINDKYKHDDFTKTDWNKPETWTAREKAYDKETTNLATEGTRLAVKQVHGVSPTGKLRAELSADGSHVVVHEIGAANKGKAGAAGSGTANFGKGKAGAAGSGTANFGHAATATDTTDVIAVLKLTRNAKGLIIKAEPLGAENSMSQTTELGKEFVQHQSVLDNATLAEQIKAKVQSILDDVTGDADGDVQLFGDPMIRMKIQSVLADFYKDPNVDNAVVYDALGEAFLEHWGVKGMKWGVRRTHTRATPVKSSNTHTLFRGHAKVQTEGGQHHPAHEDAVKVAIARQKLKKSGPAALSNKDLQDVATRLNLENQVAILTSHKGKKFVSNQLSEEGKNIARRGIQTGVRKGLKKTGKFGASVAVATLA